MKRCLQPVVFCLLSLLCVACGGNNASAQSMTLANLKGSYAGQFSGEVKTSAGYTPIDGAGIFVSDGNGNITGHETYTSDGEVCAVTIQGTYQIAADGSGTATFNYNSTTPGCGSGSFTSSLVLYQNGQSVYLTNTDSNQVSEQWHLQ